MMRSILLTFTVFMTTVLSACGFTPMHNTASDGSGLTDIAVELNKGQRITDDQAGFFITQRLRDRIGKSASTSPYRLVITPQYTRRRLGLSDGDVASRYDITVTAIWKLIDAKTGETLDNGLTSSISTFGAPAGPYGVITADNVGVEQAAQSTADKLVIKMAQYLATK